jgi:hypothetical protein
MPGAVFLWKHEGMTTTLIIAALLSGSFIGAVLGFIGAGGAMITVPILIYIFDFTPLQATTAALAVVFLTAAAGLIPKFKSNDVLIKEALTIWGLGLVTNVGLGSVAQSLPDTFILIGFSLVLIGAGISMLRGPIKDHPEKKISPIYLIWRWRRICCDTYISLVFSYLSEQGSRYISINYYLKLCNRFFSKVSKLGASRLALSSNPGHYRNIGCSTCLKVCFKGTYCSS